MNARPTLVSILLVLFSIGFIAGCSDDDDDNMNNPVIPAPQNAYEVASSLDDYSILVAAVDKAGLAGALQDPNATLTIFAPDNDAFVALLGAIGATSLDDLSAEQLAPILLYHVIGTEIDAVAATAAATAGDRVTGLGGTIQLGLSGNSIQLDGSALVEVPNVEASNGIIHGISAVILPSITDVVVSDPSFSSLATALTVADSDMSQPNLVGTLDNDGGTFTVFAPTNAACAGLVGALSASSSTGITGLADFASYQLIPVLKYHVVAGAAVMSTQVSDGPVGTLGGNVDAMVGGGVMLDGAMVTTADILTSNGVIHVIDGVLIPSITDVVTTAPEFSSLAGAIVATDSEGGTSPKVAPALDAAAASGAYTLFAPNNQAFADLGAVAPGQFLTDVLLYHVINLDNAVYAADALALGSPTEFSTLYADPDFGKVTVSNMGNPASSVLVEDTGTAAEANVTYANYFTSNGVIHVIDKVLLFDD